MIDVMDSLKRLTERVEALISERNALRAKLAATKTAKDIINRERGKATQELLIQAAIIMIICGIVFATIWGPLQSDYW